MHESGIALYHILNLGIKCKWVVSFVLQLLFPAERACDTWWASELVWIY